MTYLVSFSQKHEMPEQSGNCPWGENKNKSNNVVFLSEAEGS